MYLSASIMFSPSHPEMMLGDNLALFLPLVLISKVKRELFFLYKFVPIFKGRARTGQRDLSGSDLCIVAENDWIVKPW